MVASGDNLEPRRPSMVHGRPHEAAAGAGVQDTKASKAVRSTVGPMFRFAGGWLVAWPIREGVKASQSMFKYTLIAKDPDLGSRVTRAASEGKTTCDECVKKMFRFQ